MSKTIEKLKERGIGYIVGYVFFLIVGLIGVSFQMYKYLTNTLELVSKEYWFNPELFLIGLFIMFVFRPLALVDAIELLHKSFVNRYIK